jgi:hypothetical protein
MENILNPKIYQQAKKDADEKYKRHSAYKSMFISKRYKELGGKYKTSKKTSGGTDRWNKEQWIQVIPYLTKGEKIACGSANKKNKVCRPFKRVDKNTPVTLPELMKMHSKEDLLKLARKKNNNMNGRVFWKTLKFYQ